MLGPGCGTGERKENTKGRERQAERRKRKAAPYTVCNRFRSCPLPPSRHLLSHTGGGGGAHTALVGGESVLVKCLPLVSSLSQKPNQARGEGRLTLFPEEDHEPSKSPDAHAGGPTCLTSVRAEGTFFCFLKVEGLMLWKTEEKALLEKRGEDRGKLMLTGRSVTETVKGKGSKCPRGEACQFFETPVPVNQLPVLLEMGTNLTVGFKCDQKSGHTPFY